MTFEPQVPDWGKKLVGDNLEQLIIYHDWLCKTAIKTGLISPKSKQFVWDEFVVHSLYFGKIISELEKNEKIDKNLLRYLTVKVKKFDLDTNYFKKNEENENLEKN